MATIPKVVDSVGLNDFRPIRDKIHLHARNEPRLEDATSCSLGAYYKNIGGKN